jgi:hypothetical protein
VPEAAASSKVVEAAASASKVVEAAASASASKVVEAAETTKRQAVSLAKFQTMTMPIPEIEYPSFLRFPVLLLHWGVSVLLLYLFGQCERG